MNRILFIITITITCLCFVTFAEDSKNDLKKSYSKKSSKSLTKAGKKLFDKASSLSDDMVALMKFMKVVNDYPNSIYAEKSQVIIIEYWLKNNKTTAIVEMKKYFRLFPQGEQINKVSEYFVKNLVARADLMYQKEKWNDARALYEQIIKVTPGDESINSKIMTCKKEYAFENEQRAKGLTKSKSGWVVKKSFYGSTNPSPIVLSKASVQNKKVEIFITDWCPHCKNLEKFLNANRIKYKKYDIEKSAAGQKEYNRMGKGGVPITRVGSKIIRGYNPDAILRAIK